MVQSVAWSSDLSRQVTENRGLSGVNLTSLLLRLMRRQVAGTDVLDSNTGVVEKSPLRQLFGELFRGVVEVVAKGVLRKERKAEDR